MIIWHLLHPTMADLFAGHIIMAYLCRITRLYLLILPVTQQFVPYLIFCIIMQLSLSNVFLQPTRINNLCWCSCLYQLPKAFFKSIFNGQPTCIQETENRGKTLNQCIHLNFAAWRSKVCCLLNPAYFFAERQEFEYCGAAVFNAD